MRTNTFVSRFLVLAFFFLIVWFSISKLNSKCRSSSWGDSTLVAENNNTSLFIIISHYFTVRVPNQLALGLGELLHAENYNGEMLVVTWRYVYPSHRPTIGSLRCGRFRRDGDVKTDLDWGEFNCVCDFQHSRRRPHVGDVSLRILPSQWKREYLYRYFFLVLFIACLFVCLFVSVSLLAQTTWGCAKQL